MGGSSSSTRKTKQPPSISVKTSPPPPLQPRTTPTTAASTWHKTGISTTTVATTSTSTKSSSKVSTVYIDNRTRTSASLRSSARISLAQSSLAAPKPFGSTTTRASASHTSPTRISLSQSPLAAPKPAGSTTTRASASHTSSASASLSQSRPVVPKPPVRTKTRACASQKSSASTSLSQSIPAVPKPASQEVENSANNYLIPSAPTSRHLQQYITPCQGKSYAKLLVCPQYNGHECVAELCRRLHVCFHWATTTCEKIKCRRDHSLHTLHNRRLLQACKIENVQESEVSRIIKTDIWSSSQQEEPQICMYGVLKRCNKKPCPRVHSAKNYLWEIKDNRGWIQLAYHQGNYLEAMYSRPCVSCVDFIPLKSPLPNNRHLRRLNSLLSEETSWSVNLEAMELKGLSSVYSIRRLSTPSDLGSIVSTATRWVWYWQCDDGSWEPYDEGIVANVYNVALSDCLEYLLRLCNDRFATFVVGGHHYEIDGKSMTQTNCGTGKVRCVRRRPSSSSVSRVSVKFDELFLPFISNKKFVKLQVVPQSSEFVFIKDLLSQTMIDVQVASIHRVQNDHLWKVYQTKKRLLISLYNGDDNAVNEQYLFHGTKHDVIDLICEENLDWKLAGTNVGRVYGSGTYFSNLAWEAHQYAESDETGNQVLLVVLVLVGKMTRGHSGMAIPPVNVSAGRNFDTTCNSDTKATIFVKYNRDEYYPAYVVRYKCERGYNCVIVGD